MSDHAKSKVPWVASIQFVTLAFWGAQLEMVQSWPGFEALAERVRQEKRTWDAYIHEALSASLFQWAGCQGKYFVSDDKSIPDLKLSYKGIEAVVECRQSRQLSDVEKENRKHWYPAVAKIAQRLEKEMPSAIIGFKASRNAVSTDGELLLQIADSFIDSWKQEDKRGTFAGSKQQHIHDKTPDGSFEMVMVVHDDGNAIFESLSENFNALLEGLPENFEGPGPETNLGIEVPSFTAPVAMAGKGTTGPVPTMDKFWYSKVSYARPGAEIEKAVINQLDKKASQLNKFRKSGANDSQLPGIIWIDHPSLNNVGSEQLEQIARRIHGKLKQNAAGHFEAVAAVMISQSRLLMSKSTQLTVQARITVALNPHNVHSLSESFPYISSVWWEELESQGVQTVTWMGREVNRLTVLPDEKTNGADLDRTQEPTMKEDERTGTFVDARAANLNLQESLNRIRNLTVMGFNVPDVVPSALNLPTSRVQMNFDYFESWSVEQATAEFKKWILTNAFRDLTEALTKMLNETYGTLIAAQAIFGDGRNTQALWEEIEKDHDAKKQEFIRLTLPDKFDRLEREFRLGINADAIKNALSINVACNCVVHRGGIVGERDLNLDGKLVISMRAVPLVHQDDTGRHEVTLPYVHQDNQLAGAERDATKSFVLGEAISFDVNDFIDLVWTIFRIGNEVERALRIHVRKYGANTIVSQSPSWELRFSSESSS